MAFVSIGNENAHLFLPLEGADEKEVGVARHRSLPASPSTSPSAGRVATGPSRGSDLFQLPSLVASKQFSGGQRFPGRGQEHLNPGCRQRLISVGTKVPADDRPCPTLNDELGRLDAGSARSSDSRVRICLPFKRVCIDHEKVCPPPKARVCFRVNAR